MLNCNTLAFVSVRTVLRKWKSIRASYTREILKMKEEQKSGSGKKTRKPYVYFEQLRFLETLTKKTSNSLESNESIIDEDATEMPGNADKLMEDRSTRLKINRKHTAKTTAKEEDELIEVLKTRIKTTTPEAEPDSDKLFLLSLLPEIRKVPPERQLKVKSDILAVIASAQGNSVHSQHQWNPQQLPSAGYPYYPLPNVNPGPPPYPSQHTPNQFVSNPLQGSYPQNPSNYVHPSSSTNNTFVNQLQQSKQTVGQQQEIRPNDTISPGSSTMTNYNTSDSEDLTQFFHFK